MSTNDPTTLYNFANGTDSAAVLHLRFQGRSRDIALDVLSLTASSADDQVRHAVAQFVDVAVTDFNHTVVERHANGNLTLRPEAVFG
ncbi:MAG TPA: hypothetical protein V6C89_06530 [Drouetiella sp.]|jgi:thymidylate synthase